MSGKFLTCCEFIKSIYSESYMVFFAISNLARRFKAARVFVVELFVRAIWSAGRMCLGDFTLHVLWAN